jgi:hypothetical protein
MLEKQCVSRGCASMAIWGFGSALNDTIRWACTAHRDLIWGGPVAPAAPIAGGGNRQGRNLPPSAGALDQGRLL